MTNPREVTACQTTNLESGLITTSSVSLLSNTLIDCACLLQGLDIGPDSLKAFQAALSDAKTIIWNGPMGVFEFEKFAKGTFGVADTLAELSGKVGSLPYCDVKCSNTSAVDLQDTGMCVGIHSSRAGW